MTRKQIKELQLNEVHTMNDYLLAFLACGISYALMEEYKYRTSAEFDGSDCWWFGEIVDIIIAGSLNIALWWVFIPKDIVDAYYEGKDEDES